GRALQLFGLQASSACGLREPPNVGVELVERAGIAASDDRHDEPLVGLNRDPEVVAVEVDDLVTVEASVQLRKLLQRGRGGLQDGWDEQLEIHAPEIALLDPGDGRDLAVRASHVLRGQS